MLVTSEDFLPVIEVDETYPSCLYHDFHWFMKVHFIFNYNIWFVSKVNLWSVLETRKSLQ